MNLKKKLGMGIASAALGISLVGGGTVAYFSDTATQASTFASGTLDLNVDPTTLVNVGNLKPGDWTNKTFKLINNGSLDIKKVKLQTSYTVTKNNGNSVDPALADKYADQIMVDFLVNKGDDGKGNDIILTKSLKQLKGMTPDQLAQEFDKEWLLIFPYYVLRDGISAGTGKESVDDFKVKFRFNDTGSPQNDLQDLKLNLTWTFEGVQEDGEER
ncbi:spore coat protein [Cytobacillus oceanisediminis]|uniref:TasA family protein n=1 Tax=Cytobacillus oceanisediminis TaxID=665099 RepID=UPI001D159CFC|nr:TasA family protein [Cytobacillus oceanisediminis]MCC3649344.1 spore coat protein [Cytobacillus oceanisediminis]